MQYIKRYLLPLIIVALIFLQIFTPNAYALEVVLSGNGEGSQSEVIVETTTTTSIEQTNEANIENDVSLDVNTGDNSATNNTGETTLIDTGDVATDVSIQNSVNLSNVEMDCCPDEIGTVISDNGSDSQNTVNLEVNNEVSISIEQSANIENNITGVANTGANSADNNTGSVLIKTGDIQVNGVIENGPINVADIDGGGGGDSLNAQIINNASGSENSIFLTFGYNSNIQINNFANIRNNVNWDLNTGGNSANGNNGNVEIITGNIFFDFLIRNGPINFGGIDWGCCDLSSPADPADPSDPSDPSDPGDPSDPSDPNDPGVGGNGEPGDPGSGSSSGDGNSSSSSSSSDSDTGGLSILGLSDTSSEKAKSLIFFVGLIMLAAGLSIVGKEMFPVFLHGNQRE